MNGESETYLFLALGVYACECISEKQRPKLRFCTSCPVGPSKRQLVPTSPVANRSVLSKAAVCCGRVRQSRGGPREMTTGHKAVCGGLCVCVCVCVCGFVGQFGVVMYRFLYSCMCK
uniref:Uncharacterized protein n=1 Tax=Octopus bimaculoides TaxID=37653 RepID=A0A0L8HNH6_OCTBM